MSDGHIPSGIAAAVQQLVEAIAPPGCLRRFLEVYPSMLEIVHRFGEYLGAGDSTGVLCVNEVFALCLRSAFGELAKCRFQRNTVAHEGAQVMAFLHGLFRHVDGVLEYQVNAVGQDQVVTWSVLDQAYPAWHVSLSPGASITVSKVDRVVNDRERVVARYCIISKVVTQHDVVAIGGSLRDFDVPPTVDAN